MRRLTIGLSLSPTWLRAGSWRHPENQPEQMFQAAPMLQAARFAEQAKLDFLFKPDALTLKSEALANGPGFSSVDPVVLMSLLAQATERIGLVPTVSATFAHPFTAARQLQSLDQLSGGRVGWNVVTSLGGAENFADTPLPAHPYANAQEFVTLVEDLRQTYPADALKFDRASGQFADPSRLTQLPPRGRYHTAGPLTVPARSPRRWPLLHAGGSAASLEFAANNADAVFAMAEHPQAAAELRTRLRERSDRRVQVLPGISLCLADTDAEARAAADAAGPAPEHVRHWSIVGTPQAAVAEILRGWRAGLLDGFIAIPTGSWRSLKLLCTDVVPALSAAGAFRTKPGDWPDAFTQ